MEHSSERGMQMRLVVIERYPYSYRAAVELIDALNHETGTMYPEFETTNNPLSQYNTRSVTVDDRDPVAAVNHESEKQAIVKSPVPPTIKFDRPTLLRVIDAEPEDGIHLHVAFDFTDGSDDGSRSHSEGEIHWPDNIAERTPVGCIGVRLMPYFPHHNTQSEPSRSESDPRLRYAEVKHFYVIPSYRGTRVMAVRRHPPQRSTWSRKSVAEELLQAVSSYARDALQVDVLVLEVGFRQVAAIKLYERMGWKKRDTYGSYVGEGVEDGGLSICYELDLTRHRALYRQTEEYDGNLCEAV